MITNGGSNCEDRNYEVQHKKGKLHAWERLEELLDEGSFREIGRDISNQVVPGLIPENKVPRDGVVTGYGTIDGKMVCVFAQDSSVMGGTVGMNHALKIVDLYQKALESGCPIIGLNDSGGARIQEGVDALSGYGKVFAQNVKVSGVIPQISVVLGSCAGGAVYSPALTDFVFAVDNVSYMFITGPDVTRAVIGEEISAEELGGVNIHARQSGVVHFRAIDEKTCFNQIKRLISFLPNNSSQDLLSSMTYNYIPKKETRIGEIIPKSNRRVYDIHEVIAEIIDEDSFLEVHKEFAKNIVVGFGKLSGITVGIIANQSKEGAGALNCDAADKGARFIRFCDSFNIPLVTLVDVPGFMPGKEEEKKGVIRHGAKMLYAYTEATVVKMTVIIRKAYGGSYLAMCAKEMGADFVYAWNNAEMAVIGAEGATAVLHRKELAMMTEVERKQYMEEESERYRREVAAVRNVARKGHIDEVILPEETRERLYSGLYLLRNKNKEFAGTKKHGNIPL